MDAVLISGMDRIVSRKNLVLLAIAEVLGRNTSAYHDLAAAIERNDELGLILCQQSLDSLPVAKKTQLWDRVRVLEDQIKRDGVGPPEMSASGKPLAN